MWRIPSAFGPRLRDMRSEGHSRLNNETWVACAAEEVADTCGSFTFPGKQQVRCLLIQISVRLDVPCRVT